MDTSKKCHSKQSRQKVKWQTLLRNHWGLEFGQSNMVRLVKPCPGRLIIILISTCTWVIISYVKLGVKQKAALRALSSRPAADLPPQPPSTDPLSTNPHGMPAEHSDLCLGCVPTRPVVIGRSSTDPPWLQPSYLPLQQLWSKTSAESTLRLYLSVSSLFVAQLLTFFFFRLLCKTFNVLLLRVTLLFIENMSE